jgi:hypothetical protein
MVTTGKIHSLEMPSAYPIIAKNQKAPTTQNAITMEFGSLPMRALSGRLGGNNSYRH